MHMDRKLVVRRKKIYINREEENKEEGEIRRKELEKKRMVETRVSMMMMKDQA